jgi:tRNA(Ile)-lysidine synthase
MYYVPVQTLSKSVLEYVRHHALLKPGDRVGIAVSGGADSVALLRLLLQLRKELGVVLSVVHFNHQLRGTESDEDERFVAGLAQHYKLELYRESGNVAVHAAEKHLSLETAARELRYQFFWQLLRKNHVSRIATAHTLDDQAETVLLKIVRGAGSRGLAGIYPQMKGIRSGHDPQKQPEIASIIRPLLATRRKDLESYLTSLGQSWREDSSNRDLRHARNRVRHGIVPRLERYLNPAVREALAETAEIARAEEEYWDAKLSRVLPQVWEAAAGAPGGVLSLPTLADLPLALQRRLVRAASESLGLQLTFQHVEEVLALRQESGKTACTMLPAGWTVVRKKDALRFKKSSPSFAQQDYQYSLLVPGSVFVRETKSRFEALLVPVNAAAGYNPEDLLDRSRLARELKIRNWRAGDRYWQAHSKAPKKIKELLQEQHVSGDERKRWPVVVSGTDVVWVRGLASPMQLRPRNTNEPAVLVRELT